MNPGFLFPPRSEGYIMMIPASRNALADWSFSGGPCSHAVSPMLFAEAAEQPDNRRVPLPVLRRRADVGRQFARWRIIFSPHGRTAAEDREPAYQPSACGPVAWETRGGHP